MDSSFSRIKRLLKRKLQPAPPPVQEEAVQLLRLYSELGGQKSITATPGLHVDPNNVQAIRQMQLFMRTGEALSTWILLETQVIGIACVLLRTVEPTKIGTIFYSIINFNVWLKIVDELFLQDSLLGEFKPKWNKIGDRLRGLKTTRDRLAHHSLYPSDPSESSLKVGTFDMRQASQDYQPLDAEAIIEFITAVDALSGRLREFVQAMVEALASTDQLREKSSAPPADRPEG